MNFIELTLFVSGDFGDKNPVCLDFFGWDEMQIILCRGYSCRD